MALAEVPTITETGGLYGALLAFQAEAPTLPKNATNPHFKSKFTSLDTIVEVIRPLLAKHGLVWTAFPCRDGNGEPALRYRLTHAESSEFMEGVMPLLLTKLDPQGQGSAITYARRYSICAVLNLIADEDDDGSHASSEPAKPAVPLDPVERRKGFARYAFAAVSNLSPKDDKPDKTEFNDLLAHATTTEEVDILLKGLSNQLTKLGGDPEAVKAAFEKQAR